MYCMWMTLLIKLRSISNGNEAAAEGIDREETSRTSGNRVELRVPLAAFQLGTPFAYARNSPCFQNGIPATSDLPERQLLVSSGKKTILN